MQKLKQYLSTAKIQMGLFLFLIAISALLHYRSLQPVQTIVLALISTIICDLVFMKLRKVPLFFPSAAIVSGLIIGLLVSPKLPWYDVVTTSIVAMSGKNFLRFTNRHIFNPASFGLFLISFLFNHTVSWWGVSFQTISKNPQSLLLFFILLTPGYVSMIRMKRYRITLSFLFTYVLLLGTFQSYQHILTTKYLLLNTLLDPTTLFFSLVMLPEPMTSPSNRKKQIFFGTFVGIIALLSGFIQFIFIPDPFIFALLLGNLIFFRLR